MQPSIKKLPLRSIFWVFARYGNVTFGGGSATIAELEREIIERRHWISHDQSRLSYALSRITPGTNLLAYCAGVGCLLRGVFGAITALVAASAPCSIMVILVTAFYEWWSQNRFFSAAMHGAFIAAVAVTAATGWTLLRPYKSSVPWQKILIGSIGSFALSCFGVTPLCVLLIAALVGFIWPVGTTKQ